MRKWIIILVMLLILIWVAYGLPDGVTIKSNPNLAMIKKSGVEKYLFTGYNWDRQGSWLQINLTVNATVYNFLRDAYENPTLQKCRIIQRYIEDDYPDATCQQIKNFLTDYIQNGWRIYQNANDRGYTQIVGNKLIITIPTIVLKDRIKVGQHSIIFIYDNVTIMEFEDDYFNTNVTITFEKNVSGTWENVFTNFTVNETENGFKFGAIDEYANETDINQYRLTYNSSNTYFETDNDSYHFEVDYVTTDDKGVRTRNYIRRSFINDDICAPIYADNGTYLGESNCEFNLTGRTQLYNTSGSYGGELDDPHVLVIVFNNNNELDPTIEMGEIQDVIGTYIKLTRQPDSVHLIVNSEDTDVIHQGSIERYYPFDYNFDSAFYDYNILNQDGTLATDTHWTPNGKYSGALNFTDGNDYATVENVVYDHTKNYTWSFWINARNVGIGSVQTIHSQVFNIFGNGFMIGFNATGALCWGRHTWFTTPVCTLTTTDTFPTNEWVHVGIVHQNTSNISIYINGALNVTGNGQNTIGSSAFTTSLGSNIYVATGVNMTLDEYMILNETVTETELNQIRTMNLTRFEDEGSLTTSLIDINQSGSTVTRINVSLPTISRITGENATAQILSANASDYDITVIPSHENLILWTRLDNASEFGENSTHVYDHANDTYLSCSGNRCPTFLNENGKYFGAMEFDGENDWLYDESYPIGRFPHLRDFTICAWIDFPSTNESQYLTIVSQDDIKRNNWRFELSFDVTQNYVVQLTQTYGGRSCSEVYNAFENPNLLGWDQGLHFYCAVVNDNAGHPTNGAIVTYYVDGTFLKTSVSLDSQCQFDDYPKEPIVIGGANNPPAPGNRTFDGIIDDVMIWNERITPTEILNLYNNGPFGFRTSGDEIPFEDNLSANHQINSNDNYIQVLLRCYNNANNSYPCTFYENLTLETWFEPGDDVAPTWSQNQTNNTINGTSTLFSVKWQDTIALSSYIFSFDNCIGSLTNDSAVAMTGSINWSNVTKTLNETLNCQVQWQVHANDSLDQWATTDLFSFNTTEEVACNIDCTTNPIISANRDCSGGNLTFTGSGTTVLNANISNYDMWWITGGCSVVNIWRVWV